MIYPVLPLSTRGQELVNQMLTVWAGEKTPDIACVLGFQSIESENLWRANCSDARDYRLDISKAIRKQLKWPKEKREIR